MALLNSEQREREESARIVRQRVSLRILGEVELVGLCTGLSNINVSGKEKAKGRNEGDESFGILKDLVGSLIGLTSLD